MDGQQLYGTTPVNTTDSRQSSALRDARSAARMTQIHLADAAKVSVRTVMRAESGKDISDENARALCSVLGLDVSALSQTAQEGVPEGGTARPANEAAADEHATEVKRDGSLRWVAGWLAQVSQAGRHSRVPALAGAFALGVLCTALVQHMPVQAEQPQAYHLPQEVGTWAGDTVTRAITDIKRPGAEGDQPLLQSSFSAEGKVSFQKAVQIISDKERVDAASLFNVVANDAATMLSEGISRGLP